MNDKSKSISYLNRCSEKCHKVDFAFLFKTPQVGFEPTTNRLTVDRSTTELLRINFAAITNNSEEETNLQVFC